MTTTCTILDGEEAVERRDFGAVPRVGESIKISRDGETRKVYVVEIVHMAAEESETADIEVHVSSHQIGN
jgi:hypothetical protein